MKLNAVRLRRLIKVCQKLQQWHKSTLSKLNADINALGDAEKKLVLSLEHSEFLAIISPGSIVRRLEFMQNERDRLSRSREELRTNAMKTDVRLKWLSKGLMRALEADDAQLLQDELGAKVERDFMNVSLPQVN